MQLLVVWSSEMERKREERRSQHHSLGTPRLAGGRRDLMTWQGGIISNSVGAAIELGVCRATVGLFTLSLTLSKMTSVVTNLPLCDSSLNK